MCPAETQTAEPRPEVRFLAAVTDTLSEPKPVRGRTSIPDLTGDLVPYYFPGRRIPRAAGTGMELLR